MLLGHNNRRGKQVRYMIDYYHDEAAVDDNNAPATKVDGRSAARRFTFRLRTFGWHVFFDVVLGWAQFYGL